MFCPNCGKQASDQARFCLHCGSVLVAVQASEQPAVKSEPAVIPEAPAAAAPAKAPKKKKKTGLIAALVLVPVLAAAVVGGLYLWNLHQNQTAYNDAMALLDAGSYEDALAKFEALEDFEDSEKQAKNLKRLQSTYDEALELLEDHEFTDAKELFEELKNYRDSREQVKYNVDYQKALYYMTCAETEDEAALDVLYEKPKARSSSEAPAKEETKAETKEEVAAEEAAFTGSLAITLYEAAADIFEALDDYRDSAVKYQECYYKMAQIYLQNEALDAALELRDNMSEADSEAIFQEYLTHCADATFLTDLEAALEARAELARAAESTNADLVAAEFDVIEKYESMRFHDEALLALYLSYMEGLNLQSSALDTDGYVKTLSKWHSGVIQRYEIVNQLHAKYGFLKNNADLSEIFIGQTDEIRASCAVEAMLEDQLYNVPLEYDDTLGAYLTLNNTSGYSFQLTLFNYFYGDGELVLETETIWDVPQGGTIDLLLEFPEDDNAWDTWYMPYTIDKFCKDGKPV